MTTIRINQNSQKSFRKRMIDDVFDKYSIKYKLLFKALQDTGSVIAGSFVMQTVLDDIWGSSDIDIWLPTKEDFNYNDFMTIMNAFLDAKNLRFHKNMKDDYLRLKSHVKMIGSFTQKGHKIQVMFLNPGISVQEAVSSFDIVACQAYFDGTKVQFINEQSKEDLVNKRLRLSRKAVSMQTIPEWIRTARRISKYIKRGFKFEDPKDWQMDIFAKSFSDLPTYEPRIPHEKVIKLWNKAFSDKDNKYDPNDTYPRLGYDISNNKLTMKLAQFKKGSPRMTQYAQMPKPDKLRYVAPPKVVIDGVEVPDTYFDYIMLEEAKVADLKKENPNSVVILGAPYGKENRREAAAYELSRIAKLLKEPSKVYFPCNINKKTIRSPNGTQREVNSGETTGRNIGLRPVYPINLDKCMIRIEVGVAYYFVPVTDINRVLKMENDTFAIFETSVKYNITASAEAMFMGNFVSADHCQAGTDKKLYRLLPIKSPEKIKVKTKNPKFRSKKSI